MFAKIFSQIFDSSIVENPEMRFTFMDLLVLCDIDGVVDMTHEAIARRTNRPIEIIRLTILELEKPDLRSRTPDDDGRRLKRLDEHRDWGWMIVNYDRFRRTASEDQRREMTRERVRKYREKTKCNGHVTHVTQGNAGNGMQKQRAEAEAKAKSTGGLPPEKTDPPEFQASWKPTKEQLVARFTEIASEIPDEFKPLWNPAFEAEQFLAHYNSNGWKVGGKTRMKSWESATITWRGRFITKCKEGKTRNGMRPDLVLAAIEKAISESPCNPQHPRHQMLKQDKKLTPEMMDGYAKLLERRKVKQAEIIRQ